MSKDPTLQNTASKGSSLAPIYPARQPSPASFTQEPTSYASGQRTPTTQKRKTTLISLIDELAQLRDEEAEKEQVPQYVFDEKRAGLVQDDRLQREGAQDFERFDKRMKGLDKELQNFSNAVRQLGSSVGLLSSSYHLRARLFQVLHLFRENAAELFQTIQKEPVEPIKRYSTRKRRKMNRPTHRMRPDIAVSSDPESLPEELQLLAQDLNTFLECLNQIPEFTDEAVNTSVISFQGDLRYWASCLKEFKEQFRFPAVERYVNDLTEEMGDHLESITEALTTFVEVGVPTIRFTQKHTANGLQNLSTVATFFSAVTATTIQYSFDQSGTHLKEAVNLLWIVSLVFSLASAINSQLAYHWRAASYRSPRSVVPWWVSIWITRTPLFFLVASVIAFSAGLVCFTFSVFSHTFIPVVTTVCTSFTSFALLAVGLWFAGDRYAFSKTKGKKWLSEVLQDIVNAGKIYLGIHWLSVVIPRRFGPSAEWVLKRIRHMKDRLWKASSSVYHASSSALSNLSLSNGASNGDLSRDVLPFSVSPEPIIPLSKAPERSRTFSNLSTRIPASIPPTTPPIDELHASDHQLPGTSASSILSDTQSDIGMEPSSGTRNFKALVGTIMRMNRMVSGSDPGSSRQGLNNPDSPAKGHHRRDSSIDIAPRRPSRLATIVPALRGLTTTQYLNEHTALVRHLQFSPDGQWFATCSWDRTAIIWKVNAGGSEGVEVHRKLAHPSGFVGQVAWSPDGVHLLTKTTRTVKVWSTESGVCRKTINRGHNVQSVTWMPSKTSFVSVEGSRIHIVDLNGKILNTFDLDRLRIHDVAIMPDEQRLIAVATLEKSADGLVPSKSRNEKRIIVYNLTERNIENQVPCLHEVRDVTLSVDGSFALVSYEYKAPPQLFAFRIDKTKNIARLFLVNTYIPPKTVDFAGPSYLGHFPGGKEDQIVLCAGKGGEVHIWDRETGLLLHSLRAQDHSSDLTGIAWNHASPSLMFASAFHDGMVQIWTAPMPSAFPPTPYEVVLDSPREMRPGSSMFSNF